MWNTYSTGYEIQLKRDELNIPETDFITRILGM